MLMYLDALIVLNTDIKQLVVKTQCAAQNALENTELLNVQPILKNALIVSMQITRRVIFCWILTIRRGMNAAKFYRGV